MDISALPTEIKTDVVRLIEETPEEVGGRSRGKILAVLHLRSWIKTQESPSAWSAPVRAAGKYVSELVELHEAVEAIYGNSPEGVLTRMREVDADLEALSHERRRLEGRYLALKAEAAVASGQPCPGQCPLAGLAPHAHLDMEHTAEEFQARVDSTTIED